MRRWHLMVTAAAVVAVAGAGAVVLARDGSRSSVERTVPIESVAADGRVLRVGFLVGADGCGGSAGVAVEETPTSVRLTARVRYETTDGRSVCPLAARRVTEEVRLAAPLGERAVLDASTGRPLSLETRGGTGDRA